MSYLNEIKKRFSYLIEIVNHPLNSNKKFDAVLKYIFWNIGRRLIDSDFVIKITDKCKILISNEENYSTLCYTEGLYDFHEMMFLIHLLRQDDIFFDIGANIGVYSCLISSHTGCQCLAFEPVNKTYNKLQTNIKLNNIESSVLTYRQCLGSIEGNIKFTNELGGLNHVCKEGESATTELVPICLLDNIDSDAPVAIKLDVEGYEMDVLKGGINILSNKKLKAIVVELNGSGKRYGYSDTEIDLYLKEYGFKLIKYNAFLREIEDSTLTKVTGMNGIYIRAESENSIHNVLSSGSDVICFR